MIPDGIEDKYEVIRLLQESAATAVLLVKHKAIGDVRILKAIQKSHPNATSILSEANLLSEIKSFGIPTIYDVGETTDYYYLVEEYVKGISLQEYLLQNEHISVEDLSRISIEVCKIIEKLHSFSDEPVLYRDMKPEHVILENDNIRLIDFGIAIKKSESKKNLMLGTKSFASPEQLQGEELDERCDIYGIGAMINYCLRYVPKRESLRIRSIVEQAMDKNREKRQDSVSTLKKQIEALQGRPQNEKFENKHLKKEIAIIGSDRSVGTTFIAFKLCQYLNNSKFNAVYVDKNNGKNTKNVAESLRKPKIEKGVLYHKNFAGLMSYGPAIEKNTPPNGISINDYGNIQKPESADIIFFVTSSRPWQFRNNFPDWIKDDCVIIINNFGNKLSTLELARALNKRVYMYPISTKSFDLTKSEKKLFDAITGRNGFENF